VSFGQNEAVPVGPPRLLGAYIHFAKIERCHNVCR
jgi:hypothetical protein